MIYYGNNDYRDYLAHYGILGMHWGIRRYQPYSVKPRESGKGGREVGAARSAGRTNRNGSTKKSSGYAYVDRMFEKADEARANSKFGKADRLESRAMAEAKRYLNNLDSISDNASFKRSLLDKNRPYQTGKSLEKTDRKIADTNYTTDRVSEMKTQMEEYLKDRSNTPNHPINYTPPDRATDAGKMDLNLGGKEFKGVEIHLDLDLKERAMPDFEKEEKKAINESIEQINFKDVTKALKDHVLDVEFNGGYDKKYLLDVLGKANYDELEQGKIDNLGKYVIPNYVYIPPESYRSKSKKRTTILLFRSRIEQEHGIGIKIEDGKIVFVGQEGDVL